jgi:hypothetical protein|tara:strand:+ start:198 stop:461 length:264 start_codon:yes stop_codon:yes gene_type:complete
MERFRADALAIGCLVGFKHFSTSTRGREELLVTVRHGDDATEDGGAPEGGHRGGSDEEGTRCDARGENAREFSRPALPRWMTTTVLT